MILSQMEDLHKYYLEQYELPDIRNIMRGAKPLYPVGVDSKITSYERMPARYGRSGVIKAIRFVRSSSWNFTNSIYECELEGIKRRIALREWEFIPTPYPHDYQVGEIAILCNEFHLGPHRGSFLTPNKVEILEKEHNNNLGFSKYKVRRIGRKAVSTVLGLNLAKLRILPFSKFYTIGEEPQERLIRPHLLFGESA